MALAEVERPQVFIPERTRERPALQFGQWYGGGVLTNEDVERWGIKTPGGNPITAEFIQERTGVLRRNIARGNETVRVMGRNAAMGLVRARNKVDSVIFTTSFPIPGLNHADQLVEDLNLEADYAIEVAAACSGYTRAIQLIHQNPKLYGDDVLIVSSEKYSPYLVNLRFAPVELDASMAQLLFSDGAVANRHNMKRSETLSSVSRVIESDDIQMPADYSNPVGNTDYLPTSKSRYDGCYFAQNGREVIKTLARTIPELVDEAVVEAGLKPEAIDLVVPHQPSRPALEAISRRSPHYKYLADFGGGNFSSASIPMALFKSFEGRAHDALQAGAPIRGDFSLNGSGKTVVEVGFGARFMAIANVRQYH